MWQDDPSDSVSFPAVGELDQRVEQEIESFRLRLCQVHGISYRGLPSTMELYASAGFAGCGMGEMCGDLECRRANGKVSGWAPKKILTEKLYRKRMAAHFFGAVRCTAQNREAHPAQSGSCPASRASWQLLRSQFLFVVLFSRLYSSCFPIGQFLVSAI